MTEKIPVVLDTDLGSDIDDTWALAMLLRSPELDVKLILTGKQHPLPRRPHRQTPANRRADGHPYRHRPPTKRRTWPPGRVAGRLFPGGLPRAGSPRRRGCAD